MIDVATIPNRLENPVAKTKNQNVLHRLFAEIMVDAINLAFTEDNANLLIEFFCRFQIAPKRFFDNHATPMISRFIGQFHRPQLLHGLREIFRRGRQIEQPIALRIPFFVDFGE